jgi:hypothetical protein
LTSARLSACLFFGIACFLNFTVQAAAQSSGRLKGRIVAVSGDRRERLPGVLAILSGQVLGDKTLEAISDEQGEYSFNRLAAGDYKLTVNHPGFEKF